ncbi:hypothetical protein [Streptomyces sp. NPDC088400]|uniref:hypothetical protein n=1 Tax=Streptomyces sp. NPDC088400 TaxID=3365861 RepID=UPI0037F46C3C
MGGKDQGGGGATPFESMSHKQMLAWLDQAESGAVQAAADSLAAAAGEIRSIAQELKFRPERVEWKGEGNRAFVEWGSSLSGATFRLADYSDEASKWLGRASEAITEAQSAIPREKGPIATAVTPASPLEPLPEMNRLEAAAQMRRLAQSYQQSQTQMAKLELPTFQPPPTEFVPSGKQQDDAFQDLARTGDGASGTDSRSDDQAHGMSGGGVADRSMASTAYVDGASSKAIRPEPTSTTEIAGVDTQQPPTTPSVTPNSPAVVGRNDGPGGTWPGMIPPSLGGGGTSPGPFGEGRSGAGARQPLLPGRAGGVASGSAGRLPSEGIVGGRPVQAGPGRPGALPRGTVIGGESGIHGRPPMAHGAGGGMGGVGQSGMTGGRRFTGEPGGIVGGRARQPGTSGGRAFTPGGSGLVRRGTSGEGNEAKGERPDYLVEDEETWQQNRRRIVPPVID